MVMHFINNYVNEKVNLFNKTIKNIMLNYIPHEASICDDRDPPWINKHIRELIITKTMLTSHIVKIKTTHSLFINCNFFNQS